MADSVIATFAQEYFGSHLDKTYWLTELNDDTRSASLTMAANDVTALLAPGVAADCVPAMKAICEQAVYLARNYENLNEGKIATSEDIEGVSQGYSLIGSNAGISPRAEFFIKQANNTRNHRSARLSRG